MATKKTRRKSLKPAIVAAFMGIISALGLAEYKGQLKPIVNYVAEIIDDMLAPKLYGNVLSVVDGDTVVIRDESGEDVRIRLYGIDAPEGSQAYGNTSTKALASMISGKNVIVEVINIDQYGRSVAVLTVDDVNVNRWMIAEGHAWYYAAYCKKAYCREWEILESHARLNKLGLWKQSRPQAPWNYRKNH